MTPGCYDPCSNAIPNNATLLDGTYAFVPSGTGCNVSFAGFAHSDSKATGSSANCESENSSKVKLGTGNHACVGTTDVGGTSFIFYNGVGLCVEASGCSLKGKPTITLNGPDDPDYFNFGMTVVDCPQPGNPCGGGGGAILIKDPNLSFILTGVIYAPNVTCDLEANANQSSFGQVICQDATVQGGSVSGGDTITWGGSHLPIPLFQTQLIE
jgi:hypothetical protein